MKALRALSLAVTFVALPIAASTGLHGCGGPSEPDFAIQFESAALVDGTDRLVTYFYESSTTCTAVRAQLPRGPSLHGPFISEPLDQEALESGVVFTRTDIPVGRYVVLVDAVSQTGAVIGAGCAQDQQVLDQQRSKVLITINAI